MQNLIMVFLRLGKKMCKKLAYMQKKLYLCSRYAKRTEKYRYSVRAGVRCGGCAGVGLQQALEGGAIPGGET